MEVETLISHVNMSEDKLIRPAFRDLDKHVRLQEDSITFHTARFHGTDQLEVKVTEHLLTNDKVSDSHR